MADILLQAELLRKSYPAGSGTLTVLDDVSFQVERGESLAIVGPSGSGKTTLLGLCAGLDRSSEGVVKLMGQTLHLLNEDERAALRNKYVGFVFQNFQLLPTLTALENVMVPAEISGAADVREKAIALLNRVGLSDRLHHYPAQLSGGEQQRVAVARAFISDPSIVFADEPTGNLDEQNANQITTLLFGMNQEKHTTLILVTHNPDLAAKTNRILEMKGGKVVRTYSGKN
jgi:putative ABC transport system ATP-binding protein